MPIYEYRCGKCCHEFEVLLRSGDSEKSLRCPCCNAKKIKRMMSSFAATGVKSAGGSSCGSCTSTSCGPT